MAESFCRAAFPGGCTSGTRWAVVMGVVMSAAVHAGLSPKLPSHLQPCSRAHCNTLKVTDRCGECTHPPRPLTAVHPPPRNAILSCASKRVGFNDGRRRDIRALSPTSTPPGAHLAHLQLVRYAALTSPDKFGEFLHQRSLSTSDT